MPALPKTRKYDFALESSPLTHDLLEAVDCVLVVTAHRGVDYEMVSQRAGLIVDTRNTVPRDKGNVVPA